MKAEELAQLRKEAEQGLEAAIAVASTRTTRHVFLRICVGNARRYIAALEAPKGVPLVAFQDPEGEWMYRHAHEGEAPTGYYAEVNP